MSFTRTYITAVCFVHYTIKIGQAQGEHIPSALKKLACTEFLCVIAH